MQSIESKRRVAIIGAGITGLVLAERLAAKGCDVTIYERSEELGGLATWHDYGRFDWDKFYHVILPTDTNLTSYLQTIGLQERLRWRKTLTGFFVDGVFHSVSTSLEFLRFPVLSMFDKVRLALMIIYCSRINNWERLEKIPVGVWLTKVCGRRVYEKFWKPLLLAKLGRYHEKVSAVFIWTYVKRMYSARASAESSEKLGHVEGGYKTIIKVIETNIREAGGTIKTGTNVANLRPLSSGSVQVVSNSVSTGAGAPDTETSVYDKLVYTGPMSILDEIADTDLIQTKGTRQTLEYLGAICVVLLSEQSIVPYYVVNIADERVEFTGIIGMSNLVSASETDGLHMTYFVKYVASDDPLLRCDDDEIKARFADGINIMFEDFDWDSVDSVWVNRAPVVQPLQVLNFSKMVPKTVTTHPDFYILNTAQLVGGTLNNNEVVGSVVAFMDRHGDSICGSPTTETAAVSQRPASS